MLKKSNLITKLDSNYLFKSCGWIHEKELKRFTFTIEKNLIDIIAIKDKKFTQTSIFDFIK